MQDGAKPYTANVVHDYLDETFGHRVICRCFPWCHNRGDIWPLCSSEITACDFFSVRLFEKEAVHEETDQINGT